MSESIDILVSSGPGEARYLVLAEGRPVELVVDRPSLLLGSVFRGRVTALDKGLDAAFVNLGAGACPGFLPGAKALGLSEGAVVVVRVRGEAQGGKGPLLTPQEGFPPEGEAPALLRRSEPLERLRAAFPQARLVTEAHHEVDEAMAAALDPVAPLPGGGRLVIEQTAALTAIDVDSAGGRPAEVNAAAVTEIARQMRLRNLGGQVVVDFISGRDRKPLFRLVEALRQAVAADPVPTHVFGLSPLGLVELTRERRGPSLAELLCRRSLSASPETLALAALRSLLAEVLARPGARLGICAAPPVAAALAIMSAERTEAERLLGRPLVVCAEADRLPEDVLIDEVP
ncbi:Cytoplasmic axial filament protein CafA and Ribonuclease G [Paramagnetospirillum magnetotacticum MS-1]|uniref:Cytoplasmic axial filament protein CafA and Ribonuclease G n=1 Tax=Paramagnetospirillum magnetotacticum MS-1 TaxID=272627 RepID=A0A0C2V647_PARME|nr:ribonuclease E/G [Paramagnetospirillum magnetotacticum]KIM00542.1 Cytoplasmic axial filament protein CafA and Ribonuclease G [Paramagnetospirillum magnetotacticum MS-1]